ncbi:MAG: hypothetical protein JNN30_19290 [Rhodanobacteraceae bacterium]|nr:hypothetical protein [Rhodanobacteraceae bacterium]
MVSTGAQAAHSARGTAPEQRVDGESLRRAELDFILGRRAGETRDDEPAPWGLALSGGGIRSATFALGVLQALARHNLLRCFHYQSTISGGGYIGGFLQGLIRRRGFDATFAALRSTLRARACRPDPAAADDPQQPIQHLREYSNYLSPRKSALSGDTLGMIGTFVRNVLLVQVQLCALLLALSLLPLLLFHIVNRWAGAVPGVSLSIAGLLCVSAAALLGWIGTQTHRPLQDGADERPRTGVTLAALAVVVSLTTGSFLGAIGLGKLAQLPEPWEAVSLALLPSAALPARLAVMTAALYLVIWLVWVGFDSLLSALRRNDEWRSPLQRHRLRFLAASLGAAAFSGLAIFVALRVLAPWSVSEAALWHRMILGPAVTLAAVTLTGVVHVGLAGTALSDLQREVWARVGGKTAGLVLVGLVLALSLAIYGPWLLLRLSYLIGDEWRAMSGWAGISAWLFTSGSGVMLAYSQHSGGHKQRSNLVEHLVRLAPIVFVLGLLVGISLGAQALLVLGGWESRPVEALISLDAYLDYLAKGADAHVLTVTVVAAAALGIWLLFGLTVNVNEFSMNAFYRNRLVRCYLGASNTQRQPEPITNFDPYDDLVLADVVEVERDAGCRPLYPIIGTALNLVAAKQLDWQDRKAASFCLTPGYCGYIPPPSRSGAAAIGDPNVHAGATALPGSAPDPLAAALTLGSAVSISGAAVSPNMGYHSSPVVTFLLTLFDARLGWWIANPSHSTRPRADSAPYSAGWLLAEMLGLTRGGGRYVYLSDGGHFENLALYELVRRRCRFVLCVDAGADPQHTFADLGNAVHKCRVDFGADIRIDVSALRRGNDGYSARSCAVGSIVYADGSTGTLLYLKPTLTGTEPTDVAHYATAHPSFPHESTADQFFDEAQFESYRRLGDFVASSAIAPALERAGADLAGASADGLSVRDSGLKERILVELRHQWVAPISGLPQRFAEHGKAMAALFDTLRCTPALAVLDAQIYPVWTDLVAADTGVAPEASTPHQRRSRLPTGGDFRACFYFCQELMQLMESVYHDLDLERTWEHPDNRGWMNTFRHWSWAPMFRIAWAASAPTYGARFVTFCEMRLDLPRINDAVRVDECPPPAEMHWREHVTALARSGTINHVEQGILLSDPLGAVAEAAAPQLFVLRLNWKPVLSRTAERISDSTLGIALVEGGVLRALRVQDHLRKLGLGTEFMRLLLARVQVSRVEIRPGHYGPVGIVSTREAKALQEEVSALWQQALRHRRAMN